MPLPPTRCVEQSSTATVEASHQCAVQREAGTLRRHSEHEHRRRKILRYQAVYIDEIAAAGKKIYDIPMYVNAAVGDPMGEGGFGYNSGGPVVRVLDIWKKAAPSIDLLCPDIYTPAKEYYTHFCNAYARDDNPLFIPESGFRGTSGALNVIRAIADYGAIGVCCFGAESALDENDEVNEESQETDISFQMGRNIDPLLIKYHETRNIRSLIQKEFMACKLIQLPNYRITAHFQPNRRMRRQNIEGSRGRGFLVQTGENEFFLTGDNVELDFVAWADPEEENLYA